MQHAHEQAEFFQNRQQKNLFSILHRPAKEPAADCGVVFCHPVSWEKQFSYRVYCEFSRYLASAGYTSLRFDSFGFGDSDGDLVEATVRTQIDDVVDAVERLRQEGSCRKVVLLGVRLGAAIASLAAMEVPVDGLVLVSPVTNGRTYWREMLRFSRFGRMSQGQELHSSKDINARLETDGQVELDGEVFGRAFVEQLMAMDLNTQVSEFKGACLLSELATGADREAFEAFADVLQQGGARVDASLDEPKEFWLMKTRYSGYIPKGLFQKTVAWLDEGKA